MSVDRSDRRELLKQALARLQQMESQLEASERARTEPIAIVGMSCRLPGGVETPDHLWDVLRDGRDAVSEVPKDRWNVDDHYDPEPGAPGKACTRRGGFLSQVDQFDPRFFGIAPREAVSMDPQQRLLLEVSWEALEHAGQAPDHLTGSLTSVFVGITTSDYAHLIDFGDPKNSDVYAATGNALNAAAGRLSFTLGLQGPCMAIDSACSSSLVALHLACLSLRNRESHLALAGGVNVMLLPETFALFSRWGMLAPDGRCKTFDAAADGFVRGEGCVVLVLKRLSDAIANGDNVLAVIRGSAVNQDGRSSGLTVPNGPAQQAVIRRALAAAGVEPADVTYIEAHGTGTPLGDPIEVEALAGVFGKGRATDQPLAIGSIKTNIGHVEAASGLAGVMKVVLALQHGQIPKHLHVERPNPRIAWDAMPVRIVSEEIAWPRGGSPRIAGVSSFGFSGTNAHIVIEEAPASTSGDAAVAPSRQVLTLSAKTDAALEHLAGRYQEFFHANAAPLADVCFTANTGRAQFSHRLAAMGSSSDQIAQKLAEFKAGNRQSAGLICGQLNAQDAPKVAFLFTGQGSQYAGMGRGAYAREPVFRDTLDQCAAILRDELDVPLLELLFGSETARLTETQYTQPALFALEYALATLWRRWGVEPGVVLGHSVGEYVAACVAGVFDLEDGLRLIAARGRLMQALPAGGAMTAVFASEARVAAAVAAVGGAVSLAAVNGPESVVVSGAAAQVDAIVARLTAEGVRSQPLTVSHAFHSPLMEPMLGAFEAVAQQVRYRAPQIGLVSNETGRWVRAGEIDAAYWRRHVRAAVQYGISIAEVRAKGYGVFVEVGPSPTLLGMGRRCVEGGVWVPSLHQGRDEGHELQTAAATLYTQGVPVNWAAVGATPTRRRVALPTYPFQRERYWVAPIDATSSSTSARGSASGHPLLGDHVQVASAAGTHVWEGEISTERMPFLVDHRVQGLPVLPATAYIEMVTAASADAFGEAPVALTEIEYHKPLFLPVGARVTVQVAFSAGSRHDMRFSVHSQVAGVSSGKDIKWTLQATGRLRRDLPDIAPSTERVDLDAIRRRCPEEISGETFYQRQAARGNDWGPCFQGVHQVWRGNAEALSEVAVPAQLQKDFAKYYFHPAVSDACGHVLTATISLDSSGDSHSGAFVGGAIDEVRIYRRPTGARLFNYARLRTGESVGDNVLVGDVTVFDEAGVLISETRGARLWYLDHGQQDAALPQQIDQWFHELRWELATAPRAGASRSATADGPWVIYADRSGVGDALADELSRRGEPCVRIFHDTAPARVSTDVFAVRAEEAGDVVQVFDALAAEGSGTVRGVVHLWSLDAEHPGATATALDDAMLGCESGLHLVQTVAGRQLATAPRLWFVTRGAQACAGGPLSQPMQAPLWGFGRSAAVEHAEMWGGLVDLDASSTTIESARSVASEILAPDAEDQIAFRGGDRYVLRLAQEQLQDGAAGLDFRPDGAYLITGGFGGLGLEVARWMITEAARRVILMGRTPLPARALWSTLTGSQAQQVEAIRGLERMGATVHLAFADVADEGQLLRFLEQYAAEGWPPIRGVVHAAGVMQYQPLLDHDAAAMRNILAPKVKGGWLLHTLLSDAPLDFFVLFSSASAVLGSPLLASYAAANSFLDALAHHRVGLGQPALSVNWGLWSSVGMAAKFDAGDRGASAIGRTIAPEQGVSALSRLMKDGTAQAAVIPVDWKEWARLYPTFMDAPLLTHLATALHAPDQARTTASSTVRRTIMLAEGRERERLIAAHVAHSVGVVLGLPGDTLDPNQPLTSMGLDSLMAVELKNHFEADLNVTLAIVQFLQGPSLEQLNALVMQKLSDAEDVQRDRPRDGTLARSTAGGRGQAVELMEEGEI